MTDSPDPLEKITDTEIREQVREVFANDAHGTPDNISQDGCLALAHLGKDVWNAWRAAFPVEGISNSADFRGHDFRDDWLHFSGFVFGDFAAFKDAKFGGWGDFKGAQFGEWADFEGAKFGKAANFWGAKFGGLADFNGAQFDGMTNFSHVTFDQAPRFHGCELHQDTTFDGATFPPDTPKGAEGDEAAARAYRTLKLAFSKQQANHEEQRFFRLEMAEETKRASGTRRFLFRLYKWLSGYGFSLKRPLGLFVVSWLVFAGVCADYSKALDWLSFDWAALLNCLSYSLAQALPLPGLDKLSSEAFKDVPVVLLILHKVVSFTALFLGGLALRNLFKLK